jgi:hypothetical protein
LRIPAWAAANTTVAINGKPADQAIVPGAFCELRRQWRDGDQVTLDLKMPVRLEAVDEKHPLLLAVVQGPLALFAVGDRFLPFRKRDLLSIRQTAPRSADWRVVTADGEQLFRPFFGIGEATTRLYQPVSA